MRNFRARPYIIDPCPSDTSAYSSIFLGAEEFDRYRWQKFVDEHRFSYMEQLISKSCLFLDKNAWTAVHQFH